MNFICDEPSADPLDYIRFESAGIHETGIAPFDHDRRVLAVALGVLDNCVMYSSQTSLLEQTTDFLLSHTRLHFQREEEAMFRLGYERFESHAQAHGEMLLWMSANIPLLGATSRSNGMILLKHIHDWWHIHSLTHDAAYAPFFASRPQEVNNALAAFPFQTSLRFRQG